MLKRLLVLALVLCNILVVNAQQSYIVYFTDKNNVEFEPANYFDAKAIERRQLQGIAFDATDIPVNSSYVKQVLALSDSVEYASRWLNAAFCFVSDASHLDQIKALPYVAKVEKLNAQTNLVYAEEESSHEAVISKGSYREMVQIQTARLGLSDFEAKNLDGKGIRIALFDGGFPDVNTHPAFEHLRQSNRILKTWDFIKDKEFVYYGSSHGRKTLACIAGIYEGQKLGLATGAEFILAKTEIGREPYSEEVHWLEAAEWADQNGADIISSSLGYTYQRYFTKDMNGHSSLVVKAAEMAARKGMLVVNAAGNEDGSRWETIITPADGDSVLTVGGIDPESDLKISFSSLGPTADKRLKPNVVASGMVFTCNKSDIGTAQGTSFATPLIAGFAACAWQSNRNLSNMQLFDEIEKSGHLYPYFDYAHGYGIPQASYFTHHAYDIVKYLPTFKIRDEDSVFVVEIIPENYNQQKWMKDNNYLYYHIAGANGVLKSYYVLFVEQKDALRIRKDKLNAGDIVRIHFRGNTEEIKM